MGCKGDFIPSSLTAHPSPYGRFLWVDCQLEYLASCHPVRLQRALEELPATLDGIYERTLGEMDDTNWEAARRLFLCVAVACRPLRVEELAEILAFDFEAGPIPEFHEECRLQNPVEAVLSTCSTLLSLVNVKNFQVVQFAHFSVKEFLMSIRFSEKPGSLSRRYHISLTPAHTVVAQVCLGMLLHLDNNVIAPSLRQFPFAKYAAEHWFKHARFEGVSHHAEEGMKMLFDRRKPHLSIWLWIHDPTVYSWKRHERTKRPLPLRGTPLHYAAFCGLYDVVKILVNEDSRDVDSRNFDNASTPLHLALRGGHVDVARMLVEQGADVSAQDEDGWSPLHWVSRNGHVDLAWMLLEHGADVSVQGRSGGTPLHLALDNGHVDLAWMLVRHGTSVSAKDKDGWTPLHLALDNGQVDLAWILVEHGADVLSQDKDGRTSLHLASRSGHVDLARMLVGRGADASARDKDRRTPLHLASRNGHMDLSRMLVERGADVSAQGKDGRTPLHLASCNGQVDLARVLLGCGADVSAQDEDGPTPLHLSSENGHVDLARILMECGADVSAQEKGGRIPLHWALDNDHVDLARMLLERRIGAPNQDEGGWALVHCALGDGNVDLARALMQCGVDSAAHAIRQLHNNLNQSPL